MEAALVSAGVGALISLVAQPWADQASSLAQKKVARWWGAEEDLKKLSDGLWLNQSVVEDAEQKQFANKYIRDWLEQLNDVAYDAEDVLDVLATKDALQSMSMEEAMVVRQVCNILLPRSCFTSSTPLRHGIARRIREIDDKLENLAKKSKHLGLHPVGSRGQNEIPLMDRQTTSLSGDRENLFGRKKEKEAIINTLLLSSSIDLEKSSSPSSNDHQRVVSTDHKNNKVSLVPIVGMGGLGKTTLAQMVFNDGRIKEHFSFRRWISVSDDFDESRIIREILMDNNNPLEINLQRLTLERLQMKLRETLSTLNEGKFLIVLDDVWCEDQQKWEKLWVPLSQGGGCGKVIVTTRSMKVINAVSPMSTLDRPLGPMSNEDCWLIFKKRAFPNGNSGGNNNLLYASLEEIGKKIVEKLGGVPLAAKLIGGFLCNNLTVDFWRGLLESHIWEVVDKECNILPIIRLSYNHLPAHLRRCFAYCAIFPKDYTFDVSKLVRLWMAQGFIQSQGKNMRMEDIGTLYFNDLLQRSFFQSTLHGSYVMHDLIHDLAESISKDECLRIDTICRPGGVESTINNKVRHCCMATFLWLKETQGEVGKGL